MRGIGLQPRVLSRPPCQPLSGSSGGLRNAQCYSDLGGEGTGMAGAIATGLLRGPVMFVGSLLQLFGVSWLSGSHSPSPVLIYVSFRGAEATGWPHTSTSVSWVSVAAQQGSRSRANGLTWTGLRLRKTEAGSHPQLLAHIGVLPTCSGWRGLSRTLLGAGEGSLAEGRSTWREGKLREGGGALHKLFPSQSRLLPGV